MSKEPKISVIIPVYNNKHHIERAISSVVSQNYSNVELIVIDGGSIDGSRDVINKYEGHISVIVSEPDNGIYDAMNKGLNYANGDWIYFLGSDDVLNPNVLNKLVEAFSPDVVLVYGDVVFDNGWRFPSYLSPRTILQNTVHHQGAFYNRALFETFHYDNHLQILSDYELNLRIYTSKLPVRKVPTVVATCRMGGMSSQISLAIEETNIIRSRYLKSKWKNWILSYLLKAYYTQKKIRTLIYKSLSQ